MVLTLTASDVMTQNFKTINENETLHKALTLFSDDTDVLFVFDNDNNYKGLLTEKTIIRSGLDRQNTKVKKLITHAPKIKKDMPITKCAILMIENEVLQLPVFDNNYKKPMGVVTTGSMLKIASQKVFGNEKVRNVMSKDIIICSPDDTIYQILNLFRQHSISRVPVVSNNELIGVVSMHDLVEKALQLDEHPDLLLITDKKRPIFKLPAENIMTSLVETVKPFENIKETIKKMIKNNISSIIVVDDTNLPIGIITWYDLLEQLASQETSQENVKINIATKLHDIEKSEIINECKRFVEHYKKKIGDGNLYIYIKQYGHTISNKSANIDCRMRLSTNKVTVQAKSNSNNALNAVKICLKHLKARIDKELKKSIEINIKQACNATA